LNSSRKAFLATPRGRGAAASEAEADEGRYHSLLQIGLRGIAVLAGRVKASLAITGGVHTSLDVVKATMTGAHVCQLVSCLLANGPGHLRTLRAGLELWMRENEWESLAEMRGNMSFQKVPDPSAYEREAFRRMFR